MQQLPHVYLLLICQEATTLPQLYGYGHRVTSCLPQILVYATLVVLRILKSALITTSLRSLYWLLVKVRMVKTIACLCCHYHNNMAPLLICHSCSVEGNHTPTILTQAYTSSLFWMYLHTVRQHTVIASFMLFLFLAVCLVQIMLNQLHRCHPLCLIWRRICFAHIAKTEPLFLSLYIYEYFGNITDFLSIFVFVYRRFIQVY